VHKRYPILPIFTRFAPKGKANIHLYLFLAIRYTIARTCLKLREPSQEQMSVKGGVKVDHWGLGETEIERMSTAFEHEDLKKARGK